jgi:hypothetical protein
MNTTTNARKGIITPSPWFTKYFATASEKWKAKYTPAARDIKLKSSIIKPFLQPKNSPKITKTRIPRSITFMK